MQWEAIGRAVADDAIRQAMAYRRVSARVDFLRAKIEGFETLHSSVREEAVKRLEEQIETWCAAQQEEKEIHG